MSAGYAAAAATLRDLAYRLADLADRDDLPRPTPAVRLTVMPGLHIGHPANAGAVDVVADVLLGDATEQHRQPYGSQQEIYSIDRTVGGVSVTVQAVIPGPDPDELRAELAARDAELVRLRAELAARPTTLTDPDDLRDHDEEHAVDRDYEAEYAPEAAALAAALAAAGIPLYHAGDDPTDRSGDAVAGRPVFGDEGGAR